MNWQQPSKYDLVFLRFRSAYFGFRFFVDFVLLCLRLPHINRVLLMIVQQTTRVKKNFASESARMKCSLAQY